MATESARIRFLTHSALYLSLAVLLPIGFHAFGIAGRIFLPMHIPVLLAGFLAGPICGLTVGIMAPLLSHLLTGMPPTYAVPLMATELPIYGLIAGLTYNKLKLNIYLSLIIAMILGRMMFGLSLFVLGLFIKLPYSAAEFFAGGVALATGLPGVVVQIVLVPVIVAAVRRKQTGG